MEVLDNCILIVSCIVDIYLFYQFFECFLEKRDFVNKSRWKKNGCHVLAIGSIYTVNVMGNGDINLFVVPIILWIYIMIMFTARLGSRTIYFVIGIMIIIGCECLYALIFEVGNKAYKNMSDIPLQIVSLKVLTYIIFITVEQIAGKSKKKMNTTIFIKYLVVPIASLGMMLGVFYSGLDISSNSQVKVLMTLWFTLMLIGNIVLFDAFNKYSEEMYHNMEQEVLITRQEADLNYYRQMMYVQEEHTEFIHNMTHYMGILYELAQKHDDSAIVKIVGELGDRIEHVETSIYSNSPILNTILSEKKKRACIDKVEFDVYVEPGVNLNMVEDCDLIAMLGNLLENALRAAAGCEENGYVKVYIFMQDVRGFCVIKIINAYSEGIIKKGDALISAKKEKGIHGIGIKSVNKLAEKYGGYLTCNIKENEFEVILLLSVESAE